MRHETIHYSKPCCHWRLKPVTKIHPIPEVVSTQNRLDFCEDVSEAAGPPANFSSILFLVERLWCGPVVARRLLRWLYQSQSSLKSITHSHQRPPCSTFVVEPSGPQLTVHIYLYKLYLAPRARACLCKWVESYRVKLVKAYWFSQNHSRKRERWQPLASITDVRFFTPVRSHQPTCLSCTASSLEPVFPVWRPFSFGPNLLGLLIFGLSSHRKAEEPSATGCMVGVRHWRAVEHQSMHVCRRGSCLQGW